MLLSRVIVNDLSGVTVRLLAAGGSVGVDAPELVVLAAQP